MRKRLLCLAAAVSALAACHKAIEEPVVLQPEEPARTAYYLTGSALLESANQETKAWNYSTAASGEEVLRFNWADNAYAQDGTARFEGYYSVGGKWSTGRSILHNATNPTYVENDGEGNTNIHIALENNSWDDYAHMLVVYSGSDVNHMYWQNDPEEAEVTVPSDGSSISFQFSSINKEPIYVIGHDNYEVLYGVSSVPSSAVSSGAGSGGSVNFSFKHLESVFRVRLKNNSSEDITLEKVSVRAVPKVSGNREYPFAGDIRLTYTDSGSGQSLDGGEFRIEALDKYGEHYTRPDFEVKPLNSMPTMDKYGNYMGNYDYYTVAPGDIHAAYLTPFGNPDCDIRDWKFVFSVYVHDAVNYDEILLRSVTIDGNAIANQSGMNVIAPGFVYTVGILMGSPVIKVQQGDNTLLFKRYMTYSGDDEVLALKLVRNSEHPYTGEITIPASIEVDGASLPVMAVDYGACKDCTGLTKVTLPSCLQDLGYQSFMGCTSLRTVVMSGASVTSFNQSFTNCSALEALTIPASVTNLSSYDFIGCSSLHLTSSNERFVVDNEGVLYDLEDEISSRHIYNSITGDHEIALLWVAEWLTGNLVLRPHTSVIRNLSIGKTSLSSLEVPETLSVLYLGQYLFDETPNSFTLILNQSAAWYIRIDTQSKVGSNWGRYSSVGNDGRWTSTNAQNAYFCNMWSQWGSDKHFTLSVPDNGNASGYAYGAGYYPWTFLPFMSVTTH